MLNELVVRASFGIKAMCGTWSSLLVLFFTLLM